MSLIIESESSSYCCLRCCLLEKKLHAAETQIIDMKNQIDLLNMQRVNTAALIRNNNESNPNFTIKFDDDLTDNESTDTPSEIDKAAELLDGVTSFISSFDEIELGFSNYLHSTVASSPTVRQCDSSLLIDNNIKLAENQSHDSSLIILNLKREIEDLTHQNGVLVTKIESESHINEMLKIENDKFLKTLIAAKVMLASLSFLLSFLTDTEDQRGKIYRLNRMRDKARQ